MFFTVSPFLPVAVSLIYRGVTHPGRTVTVWDRGVRRGVVGPHAPTKSEFQVTSFRFQVADGELETLNLRLETNSRPRSRHRSSKRTSREPGGKARGSTRELRNRIVDGKKLRGLSHGLKLLRGLPRSFTAV